MAVLTSADRSDVISAWMRQNTDDCPLTKAQLRNAINAADDWVEANLSGLNAELPAGVRTGLTQRQKLRLLALVLNRRLELS